MQLPTVRHITAETRKRLVEEVAKPKEVALLRKKQQRQLPPALYVVVVVEGVKAFEELVRQLDK